MPTVVVWNAETELRDFLVSRRGRLTPEAAGIPVTGGSARRVPGLRREEVAMLAGVSVEYYVRFERGRATGVSAEVIDAVAGALRLDETEHEHLRALIAAGRPRLRRVDREVATAVSPAIQEILDALDMPALVKNHRLDYVAANRLGRALYPIDDVPEGQTYNASRFIFLDPRARDLFRERGVAMRNNVALLRSGAAAHPNDQRLLGLIGELSAKSAEFRELWAMQDVLRFRQGTKRYRHPLVGDVDFEYQALTMPVFPDLTMLVYGWDRDSPTDRAVELLRSWTAPEPVRDAVMDASA